MEAERVTPGPAHSRQIPLTLLVPAYSLIAFGVLILGTVLATVFSTFQEPASNKFVTTFAHDMATQPLVMASDASFWIQLGSSAGKLIAVLVFLLFAGLGAWIGSTLIRAGVHVVSPQFNEQMGRLKRRVEEIAGQVRASIPPGRNQRPG
ncbi:MAG: hypothetical protein WDN28_07605 [Chthoniobacter sp.]